MKMNKKLVFLINLFYVAYDFTKAQIEIVDGGLNWKTDGRCFGKKGIKIWFDTNGLKIVGDQVSLNFTVTVLEDIKVPPKVNLKIERCKSKENLDTCEKFFQLSNNNYCNFLNLPVWKEWFNAFEPKYNCPMKKGKYRLVNGVFDIKAFLLFPTDGWYWRIKHQLYDGVNNKLIHCFNAEGLITFKRKNM